MISEIVKKQEQNGLNGLLGRWIKGAIGIVSGRLESYAAVYIGQSMAATIFDFVNNAIDGATQGEFWQRTMQPESPETDEFPMTTVEETYLNAWVVNNWSPFYNPLVMAATLLGEKTEKGDENKLMNINSIQNTICALRSFNFRANKGSEGMLSNNAVQNRSALIEHFIVKLEQILLANIPTNFISYGQSVNLNTVSLTALDFKTDLLGTVQCINYKLVPAGTVPVKDDLISLPSTTLPISTLPVKDDTIATIQPTTPIATTPIATNPTSSDSLLEKAKNNWLWIVAAIAAYKILK